MKNKLNLLLLISFIIALCLTVWLNYQVKRKVGDISFSKSLDESTFIVCNEDKIQQYYTIGTHYSGGKKAIKKEILKNLENLTFENSGHITFRFIVNCTGKIGRFRIKTIDPELKENSFDFKKIKTLRAHIEKLENWNPGIWKDEKLDSYFILNFKIDKGRIIDIF